MTVQLTRGRLWWINGCCNHHHTLASCVLMRHQLGHAPVSGTGSLPQRASDASRQDFKDVTSERAAVFQPTQKLALQGEPLPNGAPSPAKTAPKLRGSPRASSTASKSEGERSRLLCGPGNPLPQPRGGARRPPSEVEGELNPAFNPLLFSWQAPGSQERDGAASSPASSRRLQGEPFDAHVFGAQATPRPFPKAKDTLRFVCDRRKTEAKLFSCSVRPGCFSWGRTQIDTAGAGPGELARPRRTLRLRKIRDPHLTGGILFLKP